MSTSYPSGYRQRNPPLNVNVNVNVSVSAFGMGGGGLVCKRLRLPPSFVEYYLLVECSWIRTGQGSRVKDGKRRRSTCSPWR